MPKFRYTWRRKNESGDTRHHGKIDAKNAKHAKNRIREEWGGLSCEDGGPRVLIEVKPDESAD